jgi:hypothetical protein
MVGISGVHLRMVIKIMEEGGENPPGRIQLIIPHKIRMIALECVEEECFIGFRDMQIGKPAFIRQVQLNPPKSAVNLLNSRTKCKPVSERESARMGGEGFKVRWLDDTSVLAVRMARPGNLVFIFIYTASLG